MVNTRQNANGISAPSPSSQNTVHLSQCREQKPTRTQRLAMLLQQEFLVVPILLSTKLTLQVLQVCQYVMYMFWMNAVLTDHSGIFRICCHMKRSNRPAALA